MGLKTNASKRRFIELQRPKFHLRDQAGNFLCCLDTIKRYIIYVMCTDEMPKTFDEWLED